MALEIFDQDNFEKKADQLDFATNFKRAKKPQFEPGTFTITDIKQAVKNPNRANIFVNG